MLSGSEDGTVRFSNSAQSGNVLLRDIGIPILNIDTNTDELAGPMLLVASEDEAVTVEQLILDSYQNQSESLGLVA